MEALYLPFSTIPINFIGKQGLLWIIAILFVLIFKLIISKPRKK